MPETRCYRAAELYAARGWRVFPLRPRTKTPLTPRGFHDATTNLETLRQWWIDHPAANVAIATGDGLAILDIDPRNGGNETLQRLIETHGPLPDCPMARTGGGGVHYYFRSPGPLKSRKLGPGVDLCADGHYVVAPFSVHPNGTPYEWEISPPYERGTTKPTPLPLLPSWLTDLKPRREAVQPSSDGLVREGSRNDYLASKAGSMLRTGMVYEAILQGTLAQNERACAPPLEEPEVRKIVDSITGRYAPGPDIVPRSWSRSTLTGIRNPSAGQTQYLVDGFLPRGEVTLLAATWKAGKTLIGYRLILDLLQGTDVLGYWPCPRPIPVCLLQLEMPSHEDDRRFRRLCLGGGPPPEETIRLAETGFLTVYNRPPLSLTNAEDVERLQRIILSGNHELVVIDSLIAAFAGSNLNDNSEVRHLFARAFLPLTTAGVSVLMFHHQRKISVDPDQNDPRALLLGAQAWGAAAGRIYALERLPGGLSEPPGDHYLKTKLSMTGSWTPEDFHPLALEAWDEGEGTVCRVGGEANGRTLAETAVALARLVRSHRGIPREDAEREIRGRLTISPHTFKRALSICRREDWIAPTPSDWREGRKKGETPPLWPGSAQPDS